MRALRITLGLLAICGFLLHWALGIDSTVGGWSGYVRETQQGFQNTDLLALLIAGTMLFLFSVVWAGGAWIALFLGSLSLRRIPAGVTLLISAVGLMVLDVVWYSIENSKDWYVVLAPAILIPIAGGCYLLALFIEKASSTESTPFEEGGK